MNNWARHYFFFSTILSKRANRVRLHLKTFKTGFSKRRERGQLRLSPPHWRQYWRTSICDFIFGMRSFHWQFVYFSMLGNSNLSFFYIYIFTKTSRCLPRYISLISKNHCFSLHRPYHRWESRCFSIILVPRFFGMSLIEELNLGTKAWVKPLSEKIL